MLSPPWGESPRRVMWLNQQRALPLLPPHLRQSMPKRRQLTVMFCDLVGSTPLSARLAPEDLRGIMGAYHRCVAESVLRLPADSEVVTDPEIARAVEHRLTSGAIT